MKKFLWVPLLTLLCSERSMSDDPVTKPIKKVLAFGGNGFIGSTVLQKLFDDPTQYYAVTLVSRGNWYYDSQTRIKNKLHKHIICDREESDLEHCTQLITYVQESGGIDIVLDFSAYNSQVLETTLELFKENNVKVGVYVYISSDSIYEVCSSSKVVRLATEEDDHRPDSEDDRNFLIEADAYGNDKLMGEELLRSPENKIPYVIFRLPDVIGPRDTTDRWWTYQMWIQFYSFIKVPIMIPVENRLLKTSYVFVEDIAEAVLLALNKPEAWNSVYNLGLEEPLSLQEFIVGLAKELDVVVTFDTGEFNVFPSVSRGSVSIEKAKSVLGFSPSTWEHVYKKTVKFYKEAFYTFPSERDDAANQLTRFVVPKHRKGDFLKLIDDLSAEPTKTLEQFLGEANTPGEDERKQITPEQLFEEMMTRTEL